MSESRSLRKRSKRRRKRKLFIGMYALIFLLIISYSGYEYLAGKHQAMSQQASAAESVDQVETVESVYKEEFNGSDNGDGKMTVLLMGVDQRGAEIARTDTIMIAEYDPAAQDAKIASLMRDLYVEIPGHGYNKLNAAFALGGPELLRETIEMNLGIDTEYYSIVDFQGFTQIVDTLSPEGMEVDVEKNMQYRSGDGTTDIQLQKGTQTLDGKELLGYVRYRSDARGDFARVERQQKVLQLMKDELLTFQGVLKAPRLIGNIQPYIDTNLGGSKMIQVGKDLLLNPVESMDMISIPTTDNVWDERKPYPIGLVLNHDEKSTKQTLQQFFEQE
ncbi:LCP family protein [Halobacillus trueperi]|uniref:LCP family protein n=1 Tax=Halobacillus trueperi TaxID=156205 RepID=UPI003735031D